MSAAPPGAPTASDPCPGCAVVLVQGAAAPAPRDLELLRALSPEVMLVSRAPAALMGWGLGLLRPVFDQDGPAAAAHAALSVSRAPRVLLLSCLPGEADLPLLRRMMLHEEDYDLLVLPDAPLPACYHRRCLRPLERSLREGGAGARPRGLKVRVLSP